MRPFMRERAREQHKREIMELQSRHRVAHAERHGLGFIERGCLACGDLYAVPEKWAARYYCDQCSAEAKYARQDAIAEVGKAIRFGVLMRADQFRCVDCDKWADCWEHRDYRYPLKVEPVCWSCNRLRGPGYTKVMIELAGNHGVAPEDAGIGRHAAPHRGGRR